MAMMSSFKKHEREQYIGQIEAATGIGFLFGPLFGAFLYNMGGYQFPFMFFATLYLLMYPLIGAILFKSNREIQHN